MLSNNNKLLSIKFVPTFPIYVNGTFEDVVNYIIPYRDDFINNGHEGLILRAVTDA
jgi:hypothetical protein